MVRKTGRLVSCQDVSETSLPSNRMSQQKFCINWLEHFSLSSSESRSILQIGSQLENSKITFSLSSHWILFNVFKSLNEINYDESDIDNLVNFSRGYNNSFFLYWAIGIQPTLPRNRNVRSERRSDERHRRRCRRRARKNETVSLPPPLSFFLQHPLPFPGLSDASPPPRKRRRRGLLRIPWWEGIFESRKMRTGLFRQKLVKQVCPQTSKEKRKRIPFLEFLHLWRKTGD